MATPTSTRSAGGALVRHGWPWLDIRMRLDDPSGQPWSWLDGPLRASAYQALHAATPTGAGAPTPWEIVLAGTTGTHSADLPPRARCWAALVLIDPERRQDRRCHHAFRPIAEAAWAAYDQAYAALSDAFGSSEMFMALCPRQGRGDLPAERLLALAATDRQRVVDHLTTALVDGGTWAAPLLARIADPTGRPS